MALSPCCECCQGRKHTLGHQEACPRHQRATPKRRAQALPKTRREATGE